ncbi:MULTISPECIES: hypothetical protein [unclassified Streptomyces]|uniref:hypothetical protein n=1 Tax=unclassified Streptomyces TaxID=2593676 RepID=UPI001660307D|nr:MULTISPECIES: hypothetical protein [unclassified Streptomyces]MBD0707074.1 hypothetical protein [Streptomyces sp. CBMA291]MBD0714331.1 hypothetical protein [Streptomyces sp. CBMA370]
MTRAPLFGVSFWMPGEPPESAAETLAWIRVPPEVLDMAEEETRSAEAREAAEFQEVDSLLRGWAEKGELDGRLARLADWVERVETVYVFVGREVFSKSDAGSNTLTREGRLPGLRLRPVDTWSTADRLFVVLAHCLFVSGRSVRFEEFNGVQLSATRLRQYLLDRHAQYVAALGRPSRAAHGVPLPELAEEVRALQEEVDRQSSLMRYRRINGMTFVKNEYLADFPQPRDPHELPELVARHGRERLGVEPTGRAREDLRALAVAATLLDAKSGPDAAPHGAVGMPHADAGEAPHGAVGELLAAIVLSAVRSTDSDYGMSSSVRDLTRLRGARPGDAEGVLELRKNDFVCCCLPHPTRMADTGEETASILWRAAQRMMYNRWHFAPGEFDRADIPEKRHYFFPPQVPDIAEHAEHHHGGHAASRVRFSIRAPGAQVWHPPFTVYGNGFRGCYDIRLVRMEKPAYTLRELREAVRHCSLVDELWRTLADGVQHGTLPVRPLGGFDRDWYASRGWERLEAYAPAPDALSVPG